MSGKSDSESYFRQLRVLKALSHVGLKQVELNEISSLSGLVDEREVQRCLYVLEGQKLVSPHPAGDFTSKYWSITSEGHRLMKVVRKNAPEAVN